MTTGTTLAVLAGCSAVPEPIAPNEAPNGAPNELLFSDGVAASSDPQNTSCADTGLNLQDAMVHDLYVAAHALEAQPIGACGALLEPWAPGDAQDVADLLAGLSAIGGFAQWNPLWLGIEYDSSCPCLEGSYWEWECTTSGGFSVTGSATAIPYPGVALNVYYDRWGVARDDEGGHLQIAVHGRDFQGWTGARLTMANTGAYDTGFNGTWIRDGHVRSGLYVSVTGVEAVPDGDLCRVDALSWGDACTLEGTGTVTLEGAAQVVVTFDGAVSCDGCGTVKIDGLEAGTICP